MLKKTLATVLIATCAATAFGDYLEARKAAVELMRKREYKEAVQALTAMAEGDYTDLQKSDAIELAVNCLVNMAEYERAAKLAREIPIDAVSKIARMRVLADQGKYEEIIETFGDEDIRTWPPRRRGQGYRLRGRAAYRVGNGEMAESDLKNALYYGMTFPNPANDKSQLYTDLGYTYRRLLDNKEKALDAFRKAQEQGSRSKGSRATFAITDILLEQGKTEEAVRVAREWVENLNLDEWTSSYWKPYILLSYGDVLKQAGRKEEAAVQYRRALQMENIRAHFKETIEERLETLDEGEADKEAAD